MQLDEILDITSLPFKPKGNRMIAACRIDGTPHSRPDKTSAVIHKGVLMIEEKGGDIMSIYRWVQIYGDGRKLPNSEIVERPKIDRIFVDSIHWEPTLPKKPNSNLFRFLVSIFGFNKVYDIFTKFHVGEKDSEEVVFWYINELMDVCHDSRVLYAKNGKRIKNRGGYRLFVPSDGYNGRCLFGSHLIPDHKGDICVVESEKTALIMNIVDDNRLWLATGGSTKTSLIKDEWKLYPDFDLAGSFWECIGCSDKSKCIISRIDNKRVKDWKCLSANKNIVYWFDSVSSNDGDDVGDYVVKTFKVE